ncbi:uncharacterized protein LOC125234214 [Leguminivora glycinivorella]|uniref:uncharacterized protein LOC125234214 n=1 Tax=Leguminivora glycinivorella TaxID=1035111 RepID=UPI00200D5FED|nr:uncharacterized protein LOC125234214 [Leguminivora glycinivorella]
MPRINPNIHKLIIVTYCTEKGISMRQLAKRFKISKDGVRKVIKKFGEYNILGDLPGRGRKKGCVKPQLDAAIVAAFRRNPSASTRDVAKKLKTSVGNVQNAKRKNYLQTRKKQKIPKRTPAQLERAKSRAKLLSKFLIQNSGRCILMDDETYVKKDMKTLPGPQFYTCAASEDIPEKHKCVAFEKFAPKILVWQAICSCGLKSSSFFTTGTINGDVYRQECIKKRILPLYRRHALPPIFWPDLASAHYAKATLNLLDAENVSYIAKIMNPPNCPELRPIERYWANIKRYLLKKGAVADNEADFKQIWNAAAHKKVVVAVFFDFRKAFDTLETNTLIDAMRECGVGEPLSQWFSDYLTARSYRVKVGSMVGDEQAVRCGVPQGSGCGPMCYLLHVNSLCGVLRHCSPHMFADDLCVLRTGAADDLAGVCRAVQQDVDAVLKWSHDNGIQKRL